MTPDGQELQIRPLVNAPASLLEYCSYCGSYLRSLMQSLMIILPKIECEHKGAARQINDFVILSGDIIRHIVLENHLAFFQSNDYKDIFLKKSPTTICRILATRANAVKEPSLFQSFLACPSRQCEENIYLFV